LKRKHGVVTDDELRKRAQKKLSARQEVIQHLASYVIVNLLLWTIFLATWRGFPWPLFVTGGWGIGLFSQLADYYYKHGPGAEKRATELEAEVIRQRRLAHERGELWDGYAEDDEDGASVYELRNVKAAGLRLSDDGELIDEAEYLRQQETR